jgi:hypothetical protein
VTDRPVFPPTILLALIVGAVFSYLELRAPGYSFCGVVAVGALATFVVIFMRSWLAWLFRDIARSLAGTQETQSNRTAAS